VSDGRCVVLEVGEARALLALARRARLEHADEVELLGRLALLVASALAAQGGRP
jgi:hypothetical protein